MENSASGSSSNAKLLSTFPRDITSKLSENEKKENIQLLDYHHQTDILYWWQM